MTSTKVLFVGKNIGQGIGVSDPTSIPEIARQTGLEVVHHLDQLPELVICADFDKSASKILKKASTLNIKTALFAYEPKVVIPIQALKKVRRKFEKIYEIGRPNSSSPIPWPQTWEPMQSKGSGERISRAVMIQSAKFSFVRGQLYGLRAILAANDGRVDVHGFGWLDSRFRTLARLVLELWIAVQARVKLDLSTARTAFLRPLNYLGSVEHKIDAMAKYKVAVVIENSQEYITEKLFDAFFARCIPVYVGPDLDIFGVPSNLYIKAQANPSSVSEAVSCGLEMDYETWMASLEDFLSRPDVRDYWESKSSTKRLLHQAVLDLGV